MAGDLIVRGDIDTQMQKYVTGTIALRDSLAKWGPEHAEEVRKNEIMLEALGKAAEKTKMVELEKEIALTKVAIARWLGTHLRKKDVTPKDIDLDKKASSRYQQVASMPKKVYDYAVKAATFPNVNNVLTQYKRYKGIKAAVEEAGKKEIEAARMFREGYSVIQAECALTPSQNDDDPYDGLSGDDDDLDNIGSFSTINFGDTVTSLEEHQEMLREDLKASVDMDETFYKAGIETLKRLNAVGRKMVELFKEVREVIK